ncbi:MAG: rhamnogalacturonan acetylesterase [Christiangramia sp.]
MNENMLQLFPKNWTFCLLILCVMNLSAQDHSPTLFLIGDSTMADKKDPDKNPEHGWGQMLPELMTAGIKIDNHAVNGRSSRSFISEGKWEAVKRKLLPGDYVWIQFGHNDEKIKDSTRFTNPFTQYWHNLEKYVRETREKGAIPILSSSIVRRNFNEEGVLVDTHGEYPLVTRLVADKMDVTFIDLQWLTEKLEIQYGPERSKLLHLHLEPEDDPYEPEGRHDDTHLSELGARLVASLALQELGKQESALEKYILPEVISTEILKN